MRYFIIRMLVNAMAIAFTVWILPGIMITPALESDAGIILAYLIAGVIFGLLNAFVRPAILLLTGDLFLTQMTLVVVVTNSLMMYLLEIITGFWVLDSPVWIIPGGMLMGLFVLILESLFGLDSPTFEDNTDPFYWHWLSRMPVAQRNQIVQNMRLRTVYNTIWHYGIDIALDHTPLSSFRHFMQRLANRRHPQADAYSDAAKVRLMLQELGPTYVKIGQMISSRADALPAEWRTELEKLQNTVPAFPFEEAAAIITEELGAPPNQLFHTFDHRPLAAASTAQVHEAILSTGEHVVVKVQRPDIVVKVATDLDVMQDVATIAERRYAWAHDNDITGILSEFGSNVLQELNYENEAFNARRLAYNMQTIPGIRVPHMYGAYTTSQVLTMDFISGVKIVEVEQIQAAGLDTTQLARTFLKAIIRQVLVDGFFHGDPHPGNVLVDTDAGDIIFLDTGMMGELTTQQRFDFIDMIWSLHNKDAYGLTKVAIKLSTPLRDVDEASLRAGIDRMLQRFFLFNEDRTGLSQILRETLNIAYDHGLRMNNELTIAVKTMIQAEEIVHTLDPKLSMIDESFKTVRGLIGEQINMETVTEIATDQVNRLSRELIGEIPTLADASLKWVRQYQRGRFSMDVNVNTGDIDREVHQLRLQLDRLILIIMIAGLIIGSAIATTVQHPDQWEGLSVLAFFVFMGSSVLGVYFTLRLLFSGDDARR